MYLPEFEHDNCGAGFICSLEGKKSNDIIGKALQILECLEHRGAVSSDGKTGDGAGIMLEVSNSFFSKQVLKMGHRTSQDSILGVGMIFLPKRDFGAQEKCRAIVEYEIIKAGMNLFGWRQVPVLSLIHI